jgi:hypothetical protein
MRWIGAIALLVGMSGHAQAQSAATPAEAQPGNPAFEAAKAAAAALGPAAVAEIQKDLIWTGDLNTLASGEFGKRSFDAVKAFQRRLKAKETGILLPAERDLLDKAAARAMTSFGFRTVAAQGISVDYPAKLVTKRSEGRHGPKFSSPDGTVTVDILRYPAEEEAPDALFERLKTERPGRTVSYSLARPDAFVITGTVDGMNFYMRFLKTATDSRGFVLGWDPKLSPGFDRIAIAMAVSLQAEGSSSPAMAAATPAAPPPVTAPPPAPQPAGPPVPLPAGASTAPRSGIGVTLSSGQDVITLATLVAGCAKVQALTVEPDDDPRSQPGIPARVVAGDPGLDLALVQLSETQPSRARLRTTALATGEAVTSLQEVYGYPGSSTVAALVGPGEDTRLFTLAKGEGAKGEGDKGAALFDSSGALVGIARPGGTIAVKPAFVAAFLRSNGASATGEATGGSDKAIVHLTCDPSKR